MVVVDLHEKRLEFARNMGADHTVNASKNDVLGCVKELLPEGPDVVFETAGSAETIAQTPFLVKEVE